MPVDARCLIALIATPLAACGGLTGLAGDGSEAAADTPLDRDLSGEDAAAGDETSEAVEVQDGGDDPAPPLSLEEYCERRIALQCAYFVSCCTPDEFEETGVSCSGDFIERQIATCMSLFAPPLEAGTLVYDGGSASSCIRALEDMAGSCANFTMYFHLFRELHLEFCEGVFSGLVPAGGVCRIDQECMDGTCVTPEDDGDGVCRLYVAPGEACSENPPCGPGAACVSGRCAALGMEGDPCDTTADLSASDCRAGLWCDAGACAPLLDSGRACTSPVSCEGACSESPEPRWCIDFCNGQ